MTNKDKEDEDYSAGTLQPSSRGRRKPYYNIFPTMEAHSAKLKIMAQESIYLQLPPEIPHI